MEYSSSSQSSLRSLCQKEDVGHFEFNVTSPILDTKRKKKKKLVVGKLVDQVKKLKKQAPKIHNDSDGTNDIGYHSNDQITIYDTKNTAAAVTAVEFFAPEVPLYKPNYSENHPHQHHKFLSRIKNYHSSHLHLITSIIHSDDGDEEDNEEEEEDENLNAFKIRHHHRHYLKMTRPTKKYFKKKKARDQASIYSFSSISSSTTTTLHKRKRLQINLTNKKKKQQHKKRVSVVFHDEKQDERKSLMQIRHQMMDFKIPADWTCISSKVNKKPTTTNFKIIQNNTCLYEKIDLEMKQIEANKSVIQEYMDKLQQLDKDLEHHLQLFSSIDTKSKGMEQASVDLKKSRLLLQQAYSRHAKLGVKSAMNPSIRLENLQIKVQSLHKSDFGWLKHFKRSCGK